MIIFITSRLVKARNNRFTHQYRMAGQHKVEPNAVSIKCAVESVKHKQHSSLHILYEHSLHEYTSGVFEAPMQC